jgi:hypothetical protein
MAMDIDDIGIADHCFAHVEERFAWSDQLEGVGEPLGKSVRIRLEVDREDRLAD